MLDEVVQSFQGQPQIIQSRIKRLIYYACTNIWPNSLSEIEHFHLKKLILELRDQNPNLIDLNILYERANTLAKPKEYCEIAKIIINELEKLYIPLKESEVVENIDKFKPEETRFLLDEVIYNLKKNDTNLLKIKKLIFCACTNDWLTNINDVKNLDLKKLIQDLREQNPTLTDLKNILSERLKRLNKRQVYQEIANIIISEMETLYLVEEPEPEISLNYSTLPTQSPSQLSRKVVILELEGNIERKIRATLEIAESSNPSYTRVEGWLPSAPNILQYYEKWQSIYRHLDVNSGRSLNVKSRLGAPPSPVSNVSSTTNFKHCYQYAQALQTILNKWYRVGMFSNIREKLLTELKPEEEILLIIRLRIQNQVLWRLPWHFFFENFLARYPNAEIALSWPEYDRVQAKSTPREKVKILAILGNSSGINIETDRSLLEALPSAETLFLVEPNRKQINDQLWEQDWDILFFAGHSQSIEETGCIYINQTDSLNIGELKYGLKQAIKRGLKLAIFNSCDGLGLAQELADLHIPQLVVMREPVPDLVAQEFLKYFLTAFSSGKSLYMAVREARERLQPLEKDYPSATYLPMICQNPATIALSWQEFRLPLNKQYEDKNESKAQLNNQGEDKQESKSSDSKVTSNQAIKVPEVQSIVYEKHNSSWQLLIGWINFYFKLYWMLFVLLCLGHLTWLQLFMLWGILLLSGLGAILSPFHRVSSQRLGINSTLKALSGILQKKVNNLDSGEESELCQDIEKYKGAMSVINKYVISCPDISSQYPQFKEINESLNRGRKESQAMYEVKKNQRLAKEKLPKQPKGKHQKYWDKL